MWRLLLVHMTPHPRAVRLATQQHLEALARTSRDGSVVSYNAVHGVPSWLRHLRFDAVLLHTTYLCMRWNVWFDHWRRHSDWLAELDCPKLAFPQDDFWWAHTLDDWLDDLGVSVVCSALGDEHHATLYPTLSRRAAFYDVLTGYIDDGSAERMRPRVAPTAARQNDIVYRARNLPYSLGSHGQLKHRIGDEVLRRAPAHDLTCNISTKPHETVLGDAWLDFMASGKATVGTESGSSTLDRRGELQVQIGELLAEEPDLTFEQVDARMPPGWDDYRFFVVSPRHLEAVVTKTAQILVEGHYSGVLEPERHYIPVANDLSDLDEALERACDDKLLADMAARAYDDVYLSGLYSSRQLTKTVEGILEEHVGSARSSTTPVFRAAAALADTQSEVDRLAVAPVANTLRTGREGFREVLAGTRLLTRDRHARRLLTDYAGSTETREHVAPRAALADLLCLGAMRRGRFLVEADLDESHHRLVLRSRLPDASANGAKLSRDDLERLLRTGAWEFAWDHSGVGRDVSVPLAAGASLELPLKAGRRTLSTLDWLSRQHPAHVAAALAAVLDGR